MDLNKETKTINVDKNQTYIVLDKENEFYFEESRKWYNQKFLSQIPGRMMYFVFLAVSLLCLYQSFQIILKLFPLKTRHNLVIKTNRDYGTKIYIKKLKINELDNNKSSAPYNIIAFFAKNYLIQRESYDFLIKESKNQSLSSILHRKKNFVKLYSSEKIFNDYNVNMAKNYDIYNMLYRSKSQRKVIVKKIKFLENKYNLMTQIYKKFTPSEPTQNIVIYYNLILNNNKIKKRKCYISYIANLDTKFNSVKRHFSFYVTSYKIIKE